MNSMLRQHHIRVQDLKSFLRGYDNNKPHAPEEWARAESLGFQPGMLVFCLDMIAAPPGLATFGKKEADQGETYRVKDMCAIVAIQSGKALCLNITASAYELRYLEVLLLEKARKAILDGRPFFYVAVRPAQPLSDASLKELEQLGNLYAQGGSRRSLAVDASGPQEPAQAVLNLLGVRLATGGLAKQVLDIGNVCHLLFAPDGKVEDKNKMLAKACFTPIGSDEVLAAAPATQAETYQEAPPPQYAEPQAYAEAQAQQQVYAEAEPQQQYPEAQPQQYAEPQQAYAEAEQQQQYPEAEPQQYAEQQQAYAEAQQYPEAQPQQYADQSAATGDGQFGTEAQGTPDGGWQQVDASEWEMSAHEQAAAAEPQQAAEQAAPAAQNPPVVEETGTFRKFTNVPPQQQDQAQAAQITAPPAQEEPAPPSAAQAQAPKEPESQGAQVDSATPVPAAEIPAQAASPWQTPATANAAPPAPTPARPALPPPGHVVKGNPFAANPQVETGIYSAFGRQPTPAPAPPPPAVPEPPSAPQTNPFLQEAAREPEPVAAAPAAEAAAAPPPEETTTDEANLSLFEKLTFKLAKAKASISRARLEAQSAPAPAPTQAAAPVVPQTAAAAPVAQEAGVQEGWAQVQEWTPQAEAGPAQPETPQESVAPALPSMSEIEQGGLLNLDDQAMDRIFAENLGIPLRSAEPTHVERGRVEEEEQAPAPIAQTGAPQQEQIPQYAEQAALPAQPALEAPLQEWASVIPVTEEPPAPPQTAEYAQPQAPESEQPQVPAYEQPQALEYEQPPAAYEQAEAVAAYAEPAQAEAEEKEASQDNLAKALSHLMESQAPILGENENAYASGFIPQDFAYQGMDQPATSPYISQFQPSGETAQPAEPAIYGTAQAPEEAAPEAALWAVEPAPQQMMVTEEEILAAQTEVPAAPAVPQYGETQWAAPQEEAQAAVAEVAAAQEEAQPAVAEWAVPQEEAQAAVAEWAVPQEEAQAAKVATPQEEAQPAVAEWAVPQEEAQPAVAEVATPQEEAQPAVAEWAVPQEEAQAAVAEVAAAQEEAQPAVAEWALPQEEAQPAVAEPAAQFEEPAVAPQEDYQQQLPPQQTAAQDEYQQPAQTAAQEDYQQVAAVSHAVPSEIAAAPQPAEEFVAPVAPPASQAPAAAIPPTPAPPPRSVTSSQETAAVMLEMSSFERKLEQQLAKAAKKLGSRVDEIKQQLAREIEALIEESNQIDKQSEAQMAEIGVRYAKQLEDVAEDVRLKVSDAAANGRYTIKQLLTTTQNQVEEQRNVLYESLRDSCKQFRSETEALTKECESRLQEMVSRRTEELAGLVDSVMDKLKDTGDGFVVKLQWRFERYKERMVDESEAVISALDRSVHSMLEEIESSFERAHDKLKASKGDYEQSVSFHVKTAELTISQQTRRHLTNLILPKLKERKEILRGMVGEMSHRFAEESAVQVNAQIAGLENSLVAARQQLSNLVQECLSNIEAVGRGQQAGLEDIFKDASTHIEKSTAEVVSILQSTEKQISETEVLCKKLAETSSVDADPTLTEERNQAHSRVLQTKQQATSELVSAIDAGCDRLEQLSQTVQDELTNQRVAQTQTVRQISEQGLQKMRDAIQEVRNAIQASREKYME